MKRKLVDRVDIKYTVVETTEDDATYVDFMPELWLVPDKPNSAFRERDLVKFYLPRRLPGQSKDKYMKFVKQAKFVCMKPEDDGMWELKDGRILRLGLDTLEDALHSQKLFSDYFSTTEAEMGIKAPSPEPPKKCVRKKKKTVPPTKNNSESDDENREVTTITNYNTRYETETQDMFTLDPTNNILPIDYSQLMNSSLFALEGGMLDEPSNEMFVSIQVPANEASNELGVGNVVIDQELGGESIVIDQHEQMTAYNNNNHQQNDRCDSSCCKGHQKVLNKIDYFQKKTSKEIGLLRQEISSNRKLLLQLLNSRQSGETTQDNQIEETEDIQDEPAQLNTVESDRFNEKYKSIFPIKDSEILVDFNNSMKTDQKFVDKLFTKLKQIKGENEIKTTRKILKELCDNRCLKDFTWQGTKNRKGVIKMKSFENLHLVVDMITKLLLLNYPDCGALSILTKVVQQRTKSAKEAFTKLMDQIALTSTAKVQDSVQPKDVINEKDSTSTAEPEIEVSTKSTAENSESDPVASCPELISDTSG